MELKGMSVEQLRALAKRANRLAEDLEASQPSIALALEHGVEDVSYNTVRWGMTASYRGEAIIEMSDGSTWRAVGRRPTGCAEWVDRRGFVEFFKLDD